MSTNYILITAARNEEAYIENTIKSVINQTVLPQKWLIVSDGSTDRTDEIVESLISKFDFIKLMRSSEEKVRSFGSKAKAVMYAYNKEKDFDFEFIGNLDADITFENDYYEQVLKKFELNEKLGIAGGVRFDVVDGKLKKVRRSKNSVAGAFQLFKRECFEQVGGYFPLKYGGIDAAAEIYARMIGWEVQSFPNFKLYHHRSTGSAGANLINYKIHNGLKLHSLGYHPLFMTLKYFAEILNKPIILGSLLTISAFFWATIFRFEKQISKDCINYLRKEQTDRVKFFLKNFFSP